MAISNAVSPTYLVNFLWFKRRMPNMNATNSTVWSPKKKIPHIRSTSKTPVMEQMAMTRYMNARMPKEPEMRLLAFHSFSSNIACVDSLNLIFS